MARMVGINHVALQVGDLEAALSFYGRIFALPLRGRVRGMAFVDLGDQFIALSEGRTQAADGGRHFGLVVDDKETVRAALRTAGVDVQPGGSLDFADPWGNHVQVVGYADVQYAKTPQALRAVGAADVGKSAAALREMREKGLA